MEVAVSACMAASVRVAEPGRCGAGRDDQGEVPAALGRADIEAQ